MTLALSGRVLAAPFLAGTLSAPALAAGKAQFPAEGVWRGEFNIDGDPVPFSFQIKGKQAKEASLTLINGSRRDTFKVRQVDAQSISVRMNTYDAVLEGKLSEDGQDRINFSFPDLQGKQVSLTDDKYKGKVVIVEVIGTWCPNCTDQTYFLSPWFKQNQRRGVEAVAVAFEQEDNYDYFKKTLSTFKDYFDIKYDIVLGGIADKKVATEKLQGLNYMAAFPTTIIIGPTARSARSTPVTPAR